MNNILAAGFIIAILVVVFAIFIRISRKVRKGGGSGATMAILGSTYDIQGRDQKRATETIVELKAGKKLEEQESSGKDE